MSSGPRAGPATGGSFRGACPDGRPARPPFASGARRLPAAALLALLAAVPAARPHAADDPRVAAVGAYFEGLPPSVSTFEQTDPDGDVRNGWFAIAPPLRARVEYEPPDSAVLVADGTFLVFHDPDAGQTSHIRLEDTPLRALLDGRIGEADRIRVLSVQEEEGLLAVQFTSLDEDGEAFPGSVALVFETGPMRLVAWQVVDVQGNVTRVRLDGLAPADLGDPDEAFRLSPAMMDRGDLWRGPWRDRRLRETNRRN